MNEVVAAAPNRRRLTLMTARFDVPWAQNFYFQCLAASCYPVRVVTG